MARISLIPLSQCTVHSVRTVMMLPPFLKLSHWINNLCPRQERLGILRSDLRRIVQHFAGWR